MCIYTPLTAFNYRAARFASVSSITLFFPASQGADTTRIYYIGFLGVWSEVRVFISPLA